MSRGRVIGLDLGERRIGVAVSDSDRRLALPVATVEVGRGHDHRGCLRELVVDYEAELVVVGLARSLDGSEGLHARRQRAEIAQLEPVLGVPVVVHDERLSTVAAHRSLAGAGLDSRARRKVVDATAAAVILQAFLDDDRT